MNNKLVRLTFALAFLMYSPISQANPNGTASEFIKVITNNLIQTLNDLKIEIKKNPSLVLSIVDEKIMPYMASTTISRKVMGQQWKIATDEQRNKFNAEFTLYLKRYYSKAFLAFDNQSIEFNESVKMKGDNMAIVSTKVMRKGSSSSVAIQYRLSKTNESWEVIDIVIEGISLVISNQRQYSGLITREGLDAVTAKLAFKNQQEFK